LFNCAGLARPPFSGLDTMLVNFVAARHLTHRVAPMMDGRVRSHDLFGRWIGWDQMLEVIAELVATDGYDAARAWLGGPPRNWLVRDRVLIAHTPNPNTLLQSESSSVVRHRMATARSP